MPITEESELVQFDAHAALSAGRAVADGTALSCIEFTEDGWHTLYVADQILGMYEDREHMRAHFETIWEELHVDIGERDLMERELDDMGHVQYFVTYMDMAAFGRVITTAAHHDIEGLWITYAAGAPLIESLEAVADEIAQTSDSDRPY